MPLSSRRSVAPAAIAEHGGDALGVDAVHRIVAVAKKMDAIGEVADGAVAGFDNCEPQVAAVEAKRGEQTPHTAGGIDNVDRRRMRILIVLGVIGVVQADSRRCGANARVRRREKDRRAADRTSGIDVLCAHRARAGRVSVAD